MATGKCSAANRRRARRRRPLFSCSPATAQTHSESCRRPSRSQSNPSSPPASHWSACRSLLPAYLQDTSGPLSPVPPLLIERGKHIHTTVASCLTIRLPSTHHPTCSYLFPFTTPFWTVHIYHPRHHHSRPCSKQYRGVIEKSTRRYLILVYILSPSTSLSWRNRNPSRRPRTIRPRCSSSQRACYHKIYGRLRWSHCKHMNLRQTTKKYASSHECILSNSICL